MAQGVSGSFELSGIKNTQAKIEYSETYDISTNSSALSVTLYIKNTWYPGNYYLNGSISINGTQAIEFDSFRGTHRVYIDSSDWIAVQASGSHAPPPWSVGDLAHYADGTGSAIIAVDVTGYGSGSGSGWSVSGSGSIALTTIPRASSIASCTQNAATQGTIALTMNRKIPNATHVATVTAGGRTLYTSASFAASLSITAARTWFASFPTATQLTATVSVQTYLSGAAIGSPVTASVTVTADEGMKPTGTGWMSYARVQQAAASGIAAYIKGYSSVRFTFDTSKLTMASGATLEGFRVVYNGITKSTAGTSVTTDILNASGTVSFTVYAIDSRGRYAETSASITVENYSPPTLSGISVQRSTAGGVPADEGTYIALAATANISSIGGLNSYTLKASYKAQGGSYGAETAMTSGVLLVIGGGLIAANQSYTARIRLTDALGNTASFEQLIATAEVAFNIRAGGGGAAFGKYAEADNELQLPEGWRIKIGSEYLAGGTNPNLLDNWYFGNPVNQRGETAYSGIGYTVDRWKLNQSNVTVSVQSGGLLMVKSGSGARQLEQLFETPLDAGRAYTVSAMCYSPDSASGVIRLANDSNQQIASVNIPQSTEYQLVSLTFTPTETMNKIYIRGGGSASNTYIRAVKLEFGSQQTLAHQENGVWVLNEIPNYGDELAKCQRYFVNLALARDHYYVGVGVTRNGICYFALSTPAAMRALPSVIEMGAAKKLEIYSDTGAHPATNFGLYNLIGNQIRGSCSCPLPDSTNYLQFQNVALTADL